MGRSWYLLWWLISEWAGITAVVEPLLRSQVAPDCSVTLLAWPFGWWSLHTLLYHRAPYNFCLISWVCSLRSKCERSARSSMAQESLLFWERSPWLCHRSLSGSWEQRGVCKHTSVHVSVCRCGHVGSGKQQRDSALLFFAVWWPCNGFVCLPLWLLGRNLAGCA